MMQTIMGYDGESWGMMQTIMGYDGVMGYGADNHGV